MDRKIAPIKTARSCSKWPIGCCLALWCTVSGSSVGAQQDQEVRSLEPGKPIERALSGGQSHSYKLTMSTGQYLHLVVDQRGIDVEIVLFAPHGKKMSEVDSTHGIEGSERVLVIPEATGTYRIEVRSSEKTARTGHYEVRVEELRGANAEDKHRVAAESAFREAEQLQDGTSEARRESIEKYHEALSLYRRAGDQGREAQTLHNIGMAYESLGEMQKALEKFKEAMPIFRATGDRIGEAMTLNNIADVYASLGDPKKALDLLNEALPITRAAGDRKGEAETLSNIGEVYFALGEPQKALDNHNEALPIRRAVGDLRGEAATLNNIGVVYRSLGEMQKSLDKYNEALPLRRAVGSRRGEANTLIGIGTVHKSLGEMQKALDRYNEALLIFRAVGDRSGEAVTLSSIGGAYFSLGEPQKALERLNEALSIRRATGDRRGEAETLTNIGEAYFSLGEIQKALDKFNEALPIRRAVGDRRGEAEALQNIGVVYRSLGEMQKALDKYNEALPIRRAVGNRRGEAITLNSIGTVHQSLGESQKALDRYNEALPLRRAVGDRRGEAETLTHIGEAYFSLGETQKALDKFNEALPIRRAGGDRRGEAATLHNIGLVYGSSGEMQRALDRLNEALSIFRAVGYRDREADTLLGIARMEQKQGNPLQARQAIEQAIGIIESLRANIAGQELRASFLATVQDYYEFSIDLLMQLHRQRPSEEHKVAAFETSERAIARSLLESLSEARADIRSGVDAALLERERALQQQLSVRAEYQTRLLSGPHTEAQSAAINKEIEAIIAQYQEVQAQIRARSPRYAALTQPVPFMLKEIQQEALDSNTMLLEYALGNGRSYLWAVTTSSVTSYELPKRSEIEAAVRRAYESLSTGSTGSTDSTGAAPTDRPGVEATHALSRMLLGPVAGQLGTKRLLIVATGALQYLPFCALPVPEMGRVGERESGKKKSSPSLPPSPPLTLSYRPLIADHEIVNLPSASTLVVLRREQSGRPSAAKQVAVLADPVFDRNDPRVKAEAGGEANSDQANRLQLERAVKEAGLIGFDRLRSTRREAEEIIALTREGEGLKALDFEASRATATSEQLAQYRIVHFGTHGLLNSRYPELSGLALSLVDEQGQPQNGFLRAHEVYNLKLGADLVVLSGCQTALGKEVKGEGLLSLTRGFMYAGAPRVVASLWRVPDKATAELMKRFYRGLLVEGLTPAAALRAAQVAGWKERRLAAPFYWAAFVLQGEWK